MTQIPILLSSNIVEIRHFHPFCGLGGGAKGFNRGHARVGKLSARFRCIGGFDVDPAAVKDFEKLAGVPATLLDFFSREQYRDFHGHEPPPGWREATTADIHAAAGFERPHIVFLSPPCKGFSGLLSESRSKELKYQALNALTVRGVFLTLEAWKDDPPELVLLENVPRILTRGRHLLDQIVALLKAYGYAVAETTHDCGELGGLAQSRKRFLLVARHIQKVPPFLYQPDKHPLRSVGSILDRMPLPGDIETAGPMHRVPALQWKTWVRLAFVAAGSDWRSLNKLAVEDGHLRDYLLMPESRWDNSRQLGVTPWDQHSGTVQARSRPGNGRFAVADPRGPNPAFTKFAITPWRGSSGTVIGGHGPSHGAYGVADPRIQGHDRSVQLGVSPWSEPAPVVTGKMVPGGGPHAVADPRIDGEPRSNRTFRIVPYTNSAPAIAGSAGPAEGLAVADPRPRAFRDGKETYATGGHYGVLPWETPSYGVTANGQHDNGWWSVADPRIDELPAPNDKLVTVIRALDGTWHRPFTTLELAALQSLVDPHEHLELEGLSDTAWRERVGNAVPPKAAEAIAGVMGTTLLLAWSGETFMLSSQPIWVKPIAIGLSVRQPH